MVIEISGEYTTARIMAENTELIEDATIDQLQDLVDHPAFTEPIRVMPDTHPGAGSPVGFTMPLGERVVPNIVGVDVGCGVAAINLGDELPYDGPERERRVREAVPMGRTVHEYDEAPHLVNEFPFERANTIFEQFNEAYIERFGTPIDPIEFSFDGYDGAYFKDLCERVLAAQRQGMGHVIRSAGTLGGGNHFIEFAKGRETGTYWCVIHSGSRYLGKAVAEHWQQTASRYRQADAIRKAIPDEYDQYLKFDPQTVSDGELYTWVTGGKGESPLRKDRIRADFSGGDIEEVFETLSSLHTVVDDRQESLDWLAGREAHGYLVDMLFAQQYARWNRTLMGDAICTALGVDPVDRFQSIHNYIDFVDLTIRKGATPARAGQRLIIPLNMADGSLLAQGKGNPEYRMTAPHGAGRVLSRSDAHDTVSLAAFTEAMEGIYSESVTTQTLDEAPMAYKSAQAMVEAIRPTAEIIEWLDPVHNIKALD